MNQKIHVVESTPGGGTVVTNPDQALLRLRMIAAGLKFEIKVPGMRLTAKAPKCTTLARRMGFRGNPQRQLEQVEAAIMEREAEIIAHNATISD